MKTLIIVESPAKAKKIQSFLGTDYKVISSFGHICDLDKKDGIDVANNFAPKYIITKQKQVGEIKTAMSSCSEVILASDEDREGEAIAWHLARILKLKDPKRIVFHEITKKALETAIKHPRLIDINMVNAQQARRILDRLVGFEVSPVLWKYVKRDLSAGRVQSVATRLIMERENDINKFESAAYYHVAGVFNRKDDKTSQDDNNKGLEGTLDNKMETEADAKVFLEKCKTAILTVADISKKRVKRYPNAPFITSTLQQEVGRKFGLSAKTIMDIAQKLYEGGFITYHRTDCVNLSDDFVGKIKTFVTEKYGAEYLNIRKYKNKSKNAQEAHEAIRPTDINRIALSGEEAEVSSAGENLSDKVYRIIWKRAVASQMAPCEVEVYNVRIALSNSSENFICKAEKVIFLGFRIVYDYVETGEDEDGEAIPEKNLKIILALKLGEIMQYREITATQKYTKPTGRYSEATLIKKLTDLEIGRPSTYANIINTIQEREYAVKETRKGRKVDFKIFKLRAGSALEESRGETNLESEKNKLFITEIGRQTTEFLIKYFPEIMDYQFTSKIEEELDEISNGQKVWNNVVGGVYHKFHPTVEKMKLGGDENLTAIGMSKKLVGKDETGNNLYAYNGKYGAVIQIGEDNSKTKKYVSVAEGTDIDTISLEDAQKIITTKAEYPKTIGTHEDKPVSLKKGKFGVYIDWNAKNYSLPATATAEPIALTLEDAITIIKDKDSKVLKVLGKTAKILSGPYGPYILSGKSFIPIPKDRQGDIENIVFADIKTFEEIAKNNKKFTKFAKSAKSDDDNTTEAKAPAKKAPVKKAPAKKSPVKKTVKKT